MKYKIPLFGTKVYLIFYKGSFQIYAISSTFFKTFHSFKKVSMMVMRICFHPSIFGPSETEINQTVSSSLSVLYTRLQNVAKNNLYCFGILLRNGLSNYLLVVQQQPRHPCSNLILNTIPTASAVSHKILSYRSSYSANFSNCFFIGRDFQTISLIVLHTKGQLN